MARRSGHPLLLLVLLPALLLGTGCASPDTKPVDSWKETEQNVEGLLESEDDGSAGYVHRSPLANHQAAELGAVAPELRNANSTLAGGTVSSAHTRRDLAASGLRYFGGSIFSATKGKIYVVFYGSWSSGRKRTILDFLYALNSKNPKGKSVPTVRDWWKINTMNYYNKGKKFVTGDISVGGAVSLGYPLKPRGTGSSKPLTMTNLHTLVKKSFAKGFPADSKALYLVLTSKDVYVDSFCSFTCSLHSYFTHRGKKIAFAFVGDSSSQCQLYCSYQYLDPSSATYNGIALDGMISMIAHELAGMATNMFQGKNSPAGWVVANTQIENVDLCSWNFGQGLRWVRKGGTVYTYNLVGPKSRKYIIQTNYNRKTQSCEMKYKSK